MREIERARRAIIKRNNLFLYEFYFIFFFSCENKERTNENRQKTLAVLLHHTFKIEPMHEINAKYLRTRSTN